MLPTKITASTIYQEDILLFHCKACRVDQLIFRLLSNIRLAVVNICRLQVSNKLTESTNSSKLLENITRVELTETRAVQYKIC